MINKPRPQERPTWRRYATAAAIVLVFLSAGYGVYRLVNGEATPRKRVMETIAMRLVPPPPPPPPKQEPPPPPPKMVEQKIEPPIEKPDAPKNEAPPEGPLALDAQGSGGGDAFGLAGKPGGTPLLLGGGNAGGGGGNGFVHYASLMQDQIGRRLRQDDKLNTNKFRATIKVWVSTGGKVDRVQVLRTTGDSRLDVLIEEVIGTMPSMPEAPPREMPQPVIVRIGAVPGVG
jgi:protein TonB